MKEYKITKERLKAMAEECPEAEGILKKGFPEAFKGEERDITEEIKWKPAEFDDGYWVMGCFEGEDYFYLNADGLHFNHVDYEREFRFEIDGGSFRIIKKA